MSATGRDVPIGEVQPYPRAPQLAPIDLSRPRRLHVVGVGGPGMSAVAITLAEMGHIVSGSDIRDRSIIDRVRRAGVTVNIGHERSVVHGCDAVTMSPAIPSNNIELDEARRAGIPVLTRSDMLSSICAMADSVAVAGTHGKTTTTSMLMLMLNDAGMQPNFIVGGDVTDVGTGAHWSGGRWLIVEADESDGTHVHLPLAGTILTNVEVDHLDHFGSFAAIIDSFRGYLAHIDGWRVLCGDDAVTARLAAELRAAGAEHVVVYGTGDNPDCDHYDVIGTDVVAEHGTTSFTVLAGDDRRELGRVDLPLRGMHNVRNATGALAMAMSLGVSFADARRSLNRFGGVGRRFDVRGQVDGITLVDDYAHLPSEIEVVLRAARTSGDPWDRVVAVFQPNRYNRMSVISDTYADAFVDADVVVITDIYSSGTTPIPGVTGKLVVDAICDAHPEQRVVWLPQRRDLIDYLAASLTSGDVCISMGCGDVATLPDEVMARRDERAATAR